MVTTGSRVLPQDEVLDPLYGATGSNRLTICSEEAVDCEGALWKPRWVLTRTSCVYDIPLWQLAVLKGDNGCDDYVKGKELGKVRRVYATFPYPDAELDISILYLDGSFGYVEKFVNESVAREALKEYEPWLRKTVHIYLYGNSYAKWYEMEVASPIRMFVMAGVLPSAALVSFFLFILFYTNPRKKIITDESTVYHFKKAPSV